MSGLMHAWKVITVLCLGMGFVWLAPESEWAAVCGGIVLAIFQISQGRMDKLNSKLDCIMKLQRS